MRFSSFFPLALMAPLLFVFGCQPDPEGDDDSGGEDDDTVVVDDDSTPTDDDTADDDSTPPDDDTTPPDDDSTPPPDDDTTPPDDDTSDDDSTPPDDADGDGYGPGEDCDDTSIYIHPGAAEFCDGVDQDCDGLTDDEPVNGSPWYIDEDGDGYGTGEEEMACAALPGTVGNNEDCDDSSGGIHPGATELCNGWDDDCDGVVDTDAEALATWYIDYDGDGYGSNAYTVTACSPPLGYVDNASDCDDTDSGASPAASEHCNGWDDDCDGTIDEADAVDATVWNQDSDGDGWGNHSVSLTACEAPFGYVDDDNDCNDARAETYPYAPEYCNGIDDNCNAVIDDPALVVNPSTSFPDADSDGYGSDDSPGTTDCSIPEGYVTDSTDCDDGEPLAHPGLTENCGDGIDNDCDGTDNGCSLQGPLAVGTGADASFYGHQVYGNFGGSMASGDVSGDGVPDFLVGASQAQVDENGEGVIYIWFGPHSGTFLAEDADATVAGGVTGAYIGGAMAVGDLNGDEVDDLAVGYSYDDTGGMMSGGVYLFPGPLAGALTLADAPVHIAGEGDYDMAGSSVALPGDVDGNGTGDLLIGAPYEGVGFNYVGAAYLWYTPAEGELSLADAPVKLMGSANYMQAGSKVTPAGDVNDDGLADFLVNAPYSSEGEPSGGAVYLWYGPVEDGVHVLADGGARILADAPSLGIGTSLAGAGDVNGDGYHDVIAGAPYSSAGGASSGAAWVFFGPLTGDYWPATADAALWGDTSADYAGTSVAGAGDVNNDGYGDMLVGATQAGTGFSPGGMVYLVYGPVTGEFDLGLADASFTTTDSMAYLGASALGMDMDEDGFSDVAMGATFGRYEGSTVGAAWLFYGGAL